MNERIEAVLPKYEALPDIWGEGALFCFSGFDGETKTRAFVAGVRAASSCSTVARYPLSGDVGTTTVVPPARPIDSG